MSAGNRVDQVSGVRVLQDLLRRVRILEAVPTSGGAACGPIIYVGTALQTAGQVDARGNSIPALIAANPGGLVVPFQNGWNNSLGTDPPVCFWTFACEVVMLGGYSGGANGSVVYTLPVGYRPPYRTPMNCAFTDFSDIAEFYVNPNGDVIHFGGF